MQALKILLGLSPGAFPASIRYQAMHPRVQVAPGDI